MNLEEITTELKDYFEPYTIDYLSHGKNKQKSDGKFYNTFVADVKEEYLTLSRDNPTLIIKEIGENESIIYKQLAGEWNPYLETIFGVTKIKDRFVSFNEFIKTPEELKMWHKTSINLEEYVLGGNGVMFPKLTEKEALVFLYQMCEGLSALHKMGIYHGDITPRNILLSDKIIADSKFDKIEGIHKSVSVKVIDFDISRKNKKEYEPVTSIMGTDRYAAPEILDFNMPRDMRVDIYSLGCLLGFMLTGESPKEKNISGKISDKCWKLIKKCTDSYDFRIKNVEILEREILKILRVADKPYLELISKIPGFRSRNIFKATVAAVFYVLWGMNEVWTWQYSDKANSFLHFFCIGAILTTIFDSFGLFRKLREKLPFLKNNYGFLYFLKGIVISAAFWIFIFLYQ